MDCVKCKYDCCNCELEKENKKLRGLLKDKIEPFHSKDISLKKNIAVKLREDGYSIRQIMQILGYKSPRSVVVLMEG